MFIVSTYIHLQTHVHRLTEEQLTRLHGIYMYIILYRCTCINPETLIIKSYPKCKKKKFIAICVTSRGRMKETVQTSNISHSRAFHPHTVL